MSDHKTINAEMFRRGPYFLFLIAITVGCTFLTVSVAVKYELPIIGIAGVLLFIVLPVILLKKIVLLFKKRAVLVFSDEEFSLSLLNFSTDVEEKAFTYSYKDIVSCTVASTSGDYSTMVINFDNDKRFDYTFSSGANDKLNISEIIFKELRQKKADLTLLPPLFASKKGTYIIFILGIIIVTSIVVQFFYYAQSIPITLLISLPTFIQIISRRKSDILSYQKLIGIA